LFGTNKIIGQKYFKEAPADSLFVTSMFFTLQGEGPYAGMPALFIRLTKCNLACSFCFVPSTLITMGDSTKKRIDQVRIGDSVMSWSGDKFEPKNVTKTYKSIAENIVKVSTNSSPVWCTPEHPFLTSNRGWVNAENLLPGDKLVHWGNKEHKTHFNPMFIESNRGTMSDGEKDKAATRLSNLWKDDDFRTANISRMKEHNPMFNPATALKGFLTRVSQIKSGLEIKIENICKDLPITFVGNGDLVISYKVPDFLVNGQKKVIEVWADDALWVKKSPRGKEWMEKRKAIFAKEGYDTLFLPLIQAELRMDEQYKIREKVAAFINNGRVVKSVEFVKDGRGWARLYGTKSADREVYNLEVEDNHTYLTNNCVVHNCDTFFDDGDWMTFEEVAIKATNTIRKYWLDRDLEVPEWVESKSRHSIGSFPKVVLVVTGGEPLLQKNLMDFFNYGKHRIDGALFGEMQIESNGTVNQSVPEFVTLVCSPKCSEKNGIATKYLSPTELILKRADCLKFVMSSDKDSPYNTVPQWAHDWSKQTGKSVYCSPMNIYNTFPQKIKLLHAEKGNITMDQRSTVVEVISFWEPDLLDLDANQKNHEYTARYCMDHGFKLNLQMHLYASLA